MSIILSILFLLSGHYEQWQDNILNYVASKVSNRPITEVQTYKDNKHLTYLSYAIFPDKENKYKEVVKNVPAFSKWLFVMRYKAKKFNELSHRGIHNNVVCNVFYDNELLLHIKTVASVFDMDVFARIFVAIKDYGDNGIVFDGQLDKNYEQEGLDKIKDFRLIFWALPYNGKVLVIMSADITSYWDIKGGHSEAYIKWQIENAMLNFGEQLR